MNCNGINRLVKCLVVVAIVVLGCFTSSIRARPVPDWSDERLAHEADLIVIAVATSSKDVNADLNNAKPDSWVEVNTVFTPMTVLKGTLEAKSLTVMHDRFFDRAMSMKIIDGPGFVEFDTMGASTGGTEYLLFLKKLKDGRFAAVSGQMDPHFSVKIVRPYTQPPRPDAHADGGVKADDADQWKNNHHDRFVTLERLPSSDDVKEVDFGKGPNVALSETQTPETFKALPASARPVDSNEKSIHTWAYSPICNGTFKTRDGTFGFQLYLGGRGMLTTPSGEKGIFSYGNPATRPSEPSSH
jgi:hypothetical protein